ncbi:Flp family type IVb pilin [Paraburkholderia sp.]|uniref:Flp family type IVb pilin n=1 Tax=Paraburkholderia sp. TaxID=1926495 RepID=UPI002D367901|nr:Flp family type IVb pilin [Paraburkholderia sp.]HZZ03349.1 Flp family type IVb pilin [Paraburkholderia sp.]
MKRFAKDERGVSAIEYAILAALIVGAVTVGAVTMGTNVKNLFVKGNAQVNNAVTKAPATN